MDKLTREAHEHGKILESMVFLRNFSKPLPVTMPRIIQSVCTNFRMNTLFSISTLRSRKSFPLSSKRALQKKENLLRSFRTIISRY